LVELAAFIQGGELRLLRSEIWIPDNSIPKQPEAAYDNPQSEYALADIHIRF